MSMETEHKARIEAEARAEQLAVETFNAFVDENLETLRAIGHWGDGECGYFLGVLQQKLGFTPKQYASQPTKEKISQSLRKAVFERDAYRCKRCETHIDLTVDHIYPESMGGATELDNLQTLCRSCNSSKGVSV